MKLPTAERLDQPSSSSLVASTALRRRLTSPVSPRSSALVFFGAAEGAAAVVASMAPVCADSSMNRNVEHAFTNGSGVFFSPKPNTCMFCARRRMASGVKSASLETIAKASKRPLCSRSMASTTIAMSEAFLPLL
jgi:hypothetical protein